ncbi:FkbM family methyltransferase [Dichotomicrobium thermohalophilum]|uniref:FkbM family methyltransferase n=1 Tax=Dichotomicrobium thermohalophilum TaxID=933063 RepID=A0A397QA79_9HYPH|nr:FkbM family methyltransferase [Dichotomicrobium thermohalophilum]RIA55024.1 FkbM family methyltransferase [Dichotomicrobium thermohalophilum]
MGPPKFQRGLREAAGITRSLWQYHASLGRARRMRAFYRLFVPAGGLVFDIGAHVGDRVRAFRALGAEVVAVEPQPRAFKCLQWLFGGSGCVHLVNAAVAETAGEVLLNINLANPTVSTASRDFVAAADGAEGWADQRWEETRTVPATTLDTLIARFGQPDFVKIDVEGFEAAALAGLSQAVPALSFEFTTIQRRVAFQCIDRLETLGDYRYNLSLGESFAMEYRHWLSARETADVIAALPHSANSGDVYAVRDTS